MFTGKHVVAYFRYTHIFCFLCSSFHLDSLIAHLGWFPLCLKYKYRVFFNAGLLVASIVFTGLKRCDLYS